MAAAVCKTELNCSVVRLFDNADLIEGTVTLVTNASPVAPPIERNWAIAPNATAKHLG